MITISLLCTVEVWVWLLVSWNRL